MTMKRRLDLRNVAFHGRSKELDVLQDAFGRIVKNDSSEIIMVHGESGTGKSSLIEKFRSVMDESCFFVSTRFHPEQTTTEPYHALAEALNEMCDLARDDKDETKRCFIEKVGSKGKELLLEIVPKLSQLIGDGDDRRSLYRGKSAARSFYRGTSVAALREYTGVSKRASVFHNGGTSVRHLGVQRDSIKSAATALNQLKYVLRAFIRTICMVLEKPLVLFLDDLHWADVSSLELIQSLMTDPELQRILFIGSYRDVDENHSLAACLDKIVREEPVRFLPLESLDLDSVNELVSKVTESDPTSTLPLTDMVHQRTHGNIFFVLQFLKTLEEEELLYFSVSSYKWAWDIDKIRAQTNLADNVVDLVANKIQRMPHNTQKILKLSACLWSTFDVELLRRVMTRARERSKVEYKDLFGCKDDLVSLLDESAQEGLLDKLVGTRYKFAHERIRQAAYSLIPEGRERQEFHQFIGEILWEMTDSPQREEWMFFAAADQMNRGAALITDEHTLLDLAWLNLLVGEKAMSLSAFVPAKSYLQSGIGHLPETCWKAHYDLTLTLYSALVSMEYCTGNLDGIEEIVNEILAHAKSTNDKVHSLYTMGLTMLAQVKQPQAGDLCRSMLVKLDEPALPKRATKTAIALESIKLKRLLRRKTDNDLLQLPFMTDGNKLNAAMFYDLIVNCMVYVGEMRNLSLAAIRLVMMTLRFGLCEESALAFALWGLVLVLKGQIQEGYRFGKLALNLGERFESGNVRANVVLFAFTFVTHWKEPLQNTLDTVLDAHHVAMMNGDITGAFQLIPLYQFNYFYSGLPLASGAQDLLAFSNQMREYNQETFRRTQAPVLQLMLNLMGRSDKSVFELTGEAMDQTEFENTETNPNRIGVQAIASCRMQLAYYFNDIELAAELSKELQGISEESMWSITFVVCVRFMFFGLISVALAKKTKKRKHAAHAQKILSRMQEKWVKQGAVNCLHKFLLLKAEYSTLKNPKSEAVRESFDLAISTARRVGFIQDEALANERAGVFFLERGDEFWASSYLSQAYKVYGEWGAQAKVESLENEHGSLLLQQEEHQPSSHLRGRARFTDKTSKDHKNLNENQLFSN